MAEMIEFVFRGDASDLASALKDVTGGLDDVGRKADDVGEKSEQGFNRTINVSKGAKVAIGAVSGAFVAAGAAAVKMARDTLKLADRLNRIAKEAKAAGATAEDFQRLEGVLGLVTKGGVDTSRVLTALDKRLAEARAGTGEATKALQAMGVDLAAVESAAPVERLALLADGVNTLGSRADKNRALLQLFEEAGAALGPAFEGGGEQIRAAAGEIESAGIISNKAAAQSEALVDAVALLQQTIQTIKDQALVPLIPTFTAFATALQQTLRPMAQTGNRGAEMARIFREVVAPALVAVAVEGRKGLAGLAVSAKAVAVAFQRVKIAFLTVTGQFKKAEQAIGDLQAAQAELDKATGDFIQTQQDADAAGQRFLETLVAQEAAARRVGDALDESAPAPVAGVSVPAAAARDAGIAETVAEGEAAIVAYREGLRASHAETMDMLQAEADEAAARVLATQQTAMQAATNIGQVVTSTITTLVAAEADALVAQTERGTEARRDAALKAFRMNKAAALINAGINTALAVTNAAATQPFIPLGIVAMAAAAAAGAVQIGVIAAKQPPQFHRGGVLSQNTADEITVRARAGEGFLSNQGVAAAGGAEGVARLNRGGRSGPDAVYVVNRVGSRMIDVQTTNAIRRTDSPLSSAIRSARPRSVGRYDPFAKV
jgi:hypothetical protein